MYSGDLFKPGMFKFSVMQVLLLKEFQLKHSTL